MQNDVQVVPLDIALELGRLGFDMFLNLPISAGLRDFGRCGYAARQDGGTHKSKSAPTKGTDTVIKDEVIQDRDGLVRSSNGATNRIIARAGQ